MRFEVVLGELCQVLKHSNRHLVLIDLIELKQDCGLGKADFQKILLGGEQSDQIDVTVLILPVKLAVLVFRLIKVFELDLLRIYLLR